MRTSGRGYERRRERKRYQISGYTGAGLAESVGQILIGWNSAQL